MFHVKHPETTPEKEPESAALLFGDRIDLARRFHDDLVEHGETLGLVGPREIDRLWTRHIVNSALVGTLVQGLSLADIGSGAGFPGLVVAIMKPDVHCVLIEPMERRSSWLTEEAKRLGLDNVEVIRARAQDVAPSVRCDAVTARAVSALKKLIPLALPLCQPGGQLLFLKGEKVHDEAVAAGSVLRVPPISSFEVVSLGSEWKTEETRIFRATLEANDNRS
jgi:16S rRNA (guanine527-N7)-methyltransferase